MIVEVKYLVCDQDGCSERLVGGGPSDSYLDARLFARRLGWTSVNVLNGLGMADYCPDHGPA